VASQGSGITQTHSYSIGLIRFGLPSSGSRRKTGVYSKGALIRRLASAGLVAAVIGTRAHAVGEQPPVVRVRGIATGFGACWRPPHEDDQVTVRLSFTLDGAVIGEPRIVFAHSGGGQADDAALADSMLAAIRECTPLKFSARLGAAIAGQVLDIRFIGRTRATIVAPP
jgi:hypothetical protein